MKRLGPLVAASIGILAVGYSSALVDWGAHHASWLVFVAAILVCMFFAVGGLVIDLVLEHREARSVRSREVSAPSLPRVPRSLPRPDGSGHGPVHARARHGMSPRARAGGDLPGR